MVVIVHTYNPEDEIWHYIAKLTSKSYVQKVLHRRIEKDFFGLDFGKINQLKSGVQSVEIHTPLNHKKDFTENILEITIAAKQAIEIYEASRSVSLNSKPVLLYYSFIRLARILFLSTYFRNYNRVAGTKTHGLEFTDDLHVKCMKAGAFPRLQDSFSSQPEIYLEEYKFKLEDLLEPPTDKFRLYTSIYQNKVITVKELSKPGHVYSIQELTREILFIYLMSMISRYKTLEWNSIIETGQYAWNITNYLRSSQSTFPNQVLNYLNGEIYAFFPEVRFGPEEEKYNPDVF